MPETKPDFFQKAIARKIANTFKLAAEEGYDVQEFVHEWLHSDVAKRIWEENPLDIAQWALYQLNSLKMELQEKGKTLPISNKSYPDEMYWLGYLLTYWGFDENLSGPELEQYDIAWIFNQYDTLHTTSVEYAIDSIKEHHAYERSLDE